MGGDGPWAIAVMWALTGCTFLFVLLRIYTRVFVVRSYGVDDHVYNLAFVLLVLYTTFTTVAAHYGFGQSMSELSPHYQRNAVLFEAIGQTFAVIGMAVAKWSLGLFLLRLVQARWHKVAIWLAMGCLLSASISVCFVFWLQCSPPRYMWDKRPPGGYCRINVIPVCMLLCILCVVVDFFFAIFPWLFIWKLRMNPREKGVILASMSLGVIAGACGIKRTIEVTGLSSSNYSKDTVGLIVWSCAEIAVTMICIGIPVCRPLYKRYLNKWATYRDTGRYQPRGEARCSPTSPASPQGYTSRPRQVSEANSLERGESFGTAKKKMKVGDPYPYAVTFMLGGTLMRDDSESEKEILGVDCSKNEHAVDLEAQENDEEKEAKDTQSRDHTN